MQSRIYFLSWAYLLQLDKVGSLSADWDSPSHSLDDLVAQISDGENGENHLGSAEQNSFAATAPLYSKATFLWSDEPSIGTPDLGVKHFRLNEPGLSVTNQRTSFTSQNLEALSGNSASREAPSSLPRQMEITFGEKERQEEGTQGKLFCDGITPASPINESSTQDAFPVPCLPSLHLNPNPPLNIHHHHHPHHPPLPPSLWRHRSDGDEGGIGNSLDEFSNGATAGFNSFPEIPHHDYYAHYGIYGRPAVPTILQAREKRLPPCGGHEARWYTGGGMLGTIGRALCSPRPPLNRKGETTGREKKESKTHSNEVKLSKPTPPPTNGRRSGAHRRKSASSESPGQQKGRKAIPSSTRSHMRLVGDARPAWQSSTSSSLDTTGSSPSAPSGKRRVPAALGEHDCFSHPPGQCPFGLTEPHTPISEEFKDHMSQRRWNFLQQVLRNMNETFNMDSVLDSLISHMVTERRPLKRGFIYLGRADGTHGWSPNIFKGNAGRERVEVYWSEDEDAHPLPPPPINLYDDYNPLRGGVVRWVIPRREYLMNSFWAGLRHKLWGWTDPQERQAVLFIDKKAFKHVILPEGKRMSRDDWAHYLAVRLPSNAHERYPYMTNGIF